MERFDFYTGEGKRVRIFMDEAGKVYFLAQDLGKVLKMKTAELVKHFGGWLFLDDGNGRYIRVYPEGAFWGFDFADEEASRRMSDLKEQAEESFFPDLRIMIADRQRSEYNKAVNRLYNDLVKLARQTVELAEKFDSIRIGRG